MKKSIVLFLVFILTAFDLASQTYKPVRDTAALKQRIENMSKATNTLESDFIQEKTLSVLADKITSKGHFVFKKENLLRWEYISPYKYLIVINKEKVWIRDEKKTTKYDMNSNKLFREINDVMIACVQGTVFKSGKFKVSYFESEKGYKLELQPLVKGMKESLKKIQLYFDKNVTSVTKMEMVEPNDDLTILDFQNKKINEPVSDSIFTVK